ncbi:DUF2797 domain-containing protein [bacterium]|nr:DUF2797 domain-containing protein [bacterium]MBU1074397.1 DUF2797 domain-containing protein [bacterium]MBU1675303.1 DUF2797 domain-containing protein [bacterium]
MRVVHDDPVSYFLRDGRHEPGERTEDLPLNALLGRSVELRFDGEIRCVACGRALKKTVGQGFCFPCSQTRADADICMVKPELCHYFESDNPCREDGFAQAKCFQPHVLYVSLTSGLKVGVTRRVNVPSRWIDQGAVRAVPLAEMPSRREVGLVEHDLSRRFDDRTHWMRMLKEEHPEGDLADMAERVLDELEVMGVPELPEEKRVEHVFRYPVLLYPRKVESFNLDKMPVAGGVLQGIKGQYLIFDAGAINVRKFTGYRVAVHGETP